MKRMEVSILFAVLFAVVLGSFGDFGVQCAEVRENMVRLHLLANSDSEEDQALKLKVRDALLEGTEEIFGSSQTKEQAEEWAREHMDRIEEIASETIRREGYDYPVRAELTNMYFSTRQYGDVTVAAGYYDAVRVTIGEGEGQNWWCVMFPPMCVPAATEDSALPLEDQIRELGTQPTYKPKFAVVELVSSLLE